MASANGKGFGQGMGQGLEQGMEQGLEQGMEQGLEQGMEQGLERGIQQGLELTALNMLAKGMSIEDVAEVTGLSTAVILELTSNKIS